MPASASETRDQDLVLQTLAGSRESFGLLVVRYSKSVRAACIARLGYASDIDDQVQEAFLRAYRGLPRLKEQDRFGAYVHRIAHNVCVDRLRREVKSVSLDEVELTPPTVPGGAQDVREERLGRMRMLVGRMPETLREAVLLFYFEQRTHAEIADLLGVTEAAINQRLHRARQHLKQAFGDGEDA